MTGAQLTAAFSESVTVTVKPVTLRVEGFHVSVTLVTLPVVLIESTDGMSLLIVTEVVVLLLVVLVKLLIWFALDAPRTVTLNG